MLTNITIGLLWLIAIAQAVVIVALVHQVSAIREMANTGAAVTVDLPIGSKAPHFTATDLRSQSAIHSLTLGGRRLVMCFLTPDCYVCRTLALELSNNSAEELAGLIVYYDGSIDDGGSILRSLADKVLVLCKDSVDVSGLFHVDKFPIAVAINESWHVTSISHPIRATDLVASLAAAAGQQLLTASAPTTLAGQS